MGENDAYLSGAVEALESFGIRTAADLLSRRMLDGPQHLGAEWLAKRLESEDDDYRVAGDGKPSYRRLEKPVQWGSRSSLEASGSNAHNYSGMTQYGGV